MEKLSLRSLDTELAQVTGTRATVKQRVRVEGGRIVADLSVSVMRKGAPGISTQLQLAPNQTVVLGQVALREDLRAEHEGEAKEALLFVTRGKPVCCEGLD